MGQPPPATASAQGRQLNGAPFPASATAEGAQFNVLRSPRLRRRRAASLRAALPLHATTPQLFPGACRYGVPGEGKYENLSYYRPEESAVEALLGRRYRM